VVRAELTFKQFAKLVVPLSPFFSLHRSKEVRCFHINVTVISPGHLYAPAAIWITARWQLATVCDPIAKGARSSSEGQGTPQTQKTQERHRQRRHSLRDHHNNANGRHSKDTQPHHLQQSSPVSKLGRRLSHSRRLDTGDCFGAATQRGRDTDSPGGIRTCKLMSPQSPHHSPSSDTSGHSTFTGISCRELTV